MPWPPPVTIATLSFKRMSATSRVFRVAFGPASSRRPGGRSTPSYGSWAHDQTFGTTASRRPEGRADGQEKTCLRPIGTDVGRRGPAVRFVHDALRRQGRVVDDDARLLEEPLHVHQGVDVRLEIRVEAVLVDVAQHVDGQAGIP